MERTLAVELSIIEDDVPQDSGDGCDYVRRASTGLNFEASLAGR